MRATRPQTPRQVRITCTPAKQVCRIYKNSMVQVLCICRSPAAQAGRRRRNPPPERSYPLNGENLIYQVRELRRNPLRSCAVPSALGTSFLVRWRWNRRRGRKTMRAPRPQTPRQVRVTCTSANRVCRLYKIFWCRCFASAAILRRNAGRVIHEIFPSEQEKTRCALPYLQRVRITCTSIKQGR